MEEDGVSVVNRTLMEDRTETENDHARVNAIVKIELLLGPEANVKKVEAIQHQGIHANIPDSKKDATEVVVGILPLLGIEMFGVEFVPISKFYLWIIAYDTFK